MPVNVSAMVRLLRPSQWVKNVLCLAGAFFSFQLADPLAVGDGLLTAALFSLVSSAVYVFNDAKDREADRAHPKKRLRPLASGEVSLPQAAALGLACLLGAVALGLLLPWGVAVCVGAYLAMNVFYTLRGKHLVIIDVMCIAMGFVLRLMAGIYAVRAQPTAWIVLCVFFLALYLGFVKRYAEIRSLRERDAGEGAQRSALARTSPEFFEQLMGVTMSMTVLCYSLFATVSGKGHTLVLTVPIVFYVLAYYKYKAQSGRGGEEPERDLVRDPVILGCAVVWLVLYYAIVTVPMLSRIVV